MALTIYRREYPKSECGPFTSIGVTHGGAGENIAFGYRTADGDTTSVFSFEHIKTETVDDAERWILEQAAGPLAEIAAFVKAAAMVRQPVPTTEGG